MTKSSSESKLYIFAYGKDIKIYTIIETIGFNALSLLSIYLIYTLCNPNTALISLPLTLLPSAFALYLLISFKRRAQGLHINLTQNVFIVHDVFYNRYFKMDRIHSFALVKRRYLDDLIFKRISYDFVFFDRAGAKVFSFDCPQDKVTELYTFLKAHFTKLN